MAAQYDYKHVKGFVQYCIFILYQRGEGVHSTCKLGVGLKNQNMYLVCPRPKKVWCVVIKML